MDDRLDPVSHYQYSYPSILLTILDEYIVTLTGVFQNCGNEMYLLDFHTWKMGLNTVKSHFNNEQISRNIYNAFTS